MKNYLINVLASFSVVLNTLTGGSYRNTFSARVGNEAYYYRKPYAKFIVKVVDSLFFWDNLHCYKEWMREKDTFNNKI